MAKKPKSDAFPPGLGQLPAGTRAAARFKILATRDSANVDVRWTTYVPSDPTTGTITSRAATWFTCEIRNLKKAHMKACLHEIGVQARQRRVFLRCFGAHHYSVTPAPDTTADDPTVPQGFFAIEQATKYTLRFSGPVCFLEGYHEKPPAGIGGGPTDGYPPPGAPCEDG